MYDQTRSFLLIWSHLLKKSLIENFIFCAVLDLIFVTNITAVHIHHGCSLLLILIFMFNLNLF